MLCTWICPRCGTCICTHLGHMHIINEKNTLPPQRDNGGANQGAWCQSARVLLLYGTSGHIWDICIKLTKKRTRVRNGKAPVFASSMGHVDTYGACGHIWEIGKYLTQKRIRARNGKAPVFTQAHFSGTPDEKKMTHTHTHTHTRILYLCTYKYRLTHTIRTQPLHPPLKH